MIVHDPDRRISFPIWCPVHKSQGGELFVQIGIGHGSDLFAPQRRLTGTDIYLELLAVAYRRNGMGHSAVRRKQLGIHAIENDEAQKLIYS